MNPQTWIIRIMECDGSRRPSRGAQQFLVKAGRAPATSTCPFASCHDQLYSWATAPEHRRLWTRRRWHLTKFPRNSNYPTPWVSFPSLHTLHTKQAQGASGQSKDAFMIVPTPDLWVMLCSLARWVHQCGSTHGRWLAMASWDGWAPVV